MSTSKTTLRLAAAGVLAFAGLTAGAAAASAGTGYAPATPTPTVSDVVTPAVSPTTGGSTPGVSSSSSATPGAVGASSDELAYTGADVAPWAAAGTVLVLGGTAMVLAGRRKGTRQH
ncbi:hypothetical protein GTR02_15655 [Kineococcus sp. R8]|uniref:hypothetical protein n=1 Tax=Kineococcus siccus TaxID=2696567 RepID=UPI0014130A8E|nr:hypothetical protein [Kineococcus siccus]NAZ83255.1 hypothetical protein [Kineococcus siccus]